MAIAADGFEERGGESGGNGRGVVVGGDGFLFLADGRHDVLAFANGERRVAPESVANFKANIAARRAACARNGARYRHIIVPDKQTVLREHFPVRDPISLGDLYMRQLDDDQTDCVAFLSDVLRRDASGAFFRTDTHLTDAGSLRAAVAIVEMFTAASHAEAHRSLLQAPISQKQKVGDLGSRFNPQRSETATVYAKNWGARRFANNLAFGNNGIVDIYFSPRSLYRTRMLIFGDSFGRNFANWLTYFFFEVVFLRTPHFYDDLVELMKPDLVLTENAERYLSFCASDAVRECFHMLPHLAGVPYAPDRSFCEAFSAILSFGRPPYADFLRRSGLSPPGA